MLGLDALGSAAYGPEAALTLADTAGSRGPGLRRPDQHADHLSSWPSFIFPTGRPSGPILTEAAPTRWPGRTSAPSAGLLAAAALMLDYVLVVAVGISAGVGALVSAIPVLQPYTLWLCLAILALITMVNLRGRARVGRGVHGSDLSVHRQLAGRAGHRGGQSGAAGGQPDADPAAAGHCRRQPMAGSLWIAMRAFASGCTAMTGVEAVSNGVTAFREPAVPTPRRPSPPSS